MITNILNVTDTTIICEYILLEFLEKLRNHKVLLRDSSNYLKYVKLKTITIFFFKI